MPSKEIKLKLSEPEFNEINLTAEAHDISRQEVIRRMIRQANVTQHNRLGVTFEDFNRVGSLIYKELGGTISRIQAEQAAAIAIRHLINTPTKNENPD